MEKFDNATGEGNILSLGDVRIGESARLAEMTGKDSICILAMEHLDCSELPLPGEDFAIKWIVRISIQSGDW